MSWEHFDVKKTGLCTVLRRETGERFQCPYQLGTVSTGKSRVFWGYQISINLGDREIIGKSQGYSESYVLALKECNWKLEAEGLLLLVAGNSAHYSESAMSGSAGYGYVSDRMAAVHIMSDIPD